MCIENILASHVEEFICAHYTLYGMHPQMTGDPLQYLSLLEQRAIPLLVHKDECRSNEQSLHIRG